MAMTSGMWSRGMKELFETKLVADESREYFFFLGPLHDQKITVHTRADRYLHTEEVKDRVPKVEYDFNDDGEMYEVKQGPQIKDMIYIKQESRGIQFYSPEGTDYSDPATVHILQEFIDKVASKMEGGAAAIIEANEKFRRMLEAARAQMEAAAWSENTGSDYGLPRKKNIVIKNNRGSVNWNK